jgi:hypothetical protein
MPPGEDDFQATIDHFEGLLDAEDAPPEKPKRAARAARDDDDEDPELQAAGDEDEEPVDDEDAAADDRPAKDEDEPEDEPEEEPEETALDLKQIVRVNVDGEPAEVSLQEALNGYVRAETFHRRLNQIGQVASEMERERGEIAQARAYYAQMIPALHKQLLSLQPTEPDWDKLYAEDANEAARLERQWRTYREKLGQLQEEHRRVQEEAQAEEQRRLKIYEDTERRKLVQAIPEWTDAKRWERDRRSMVRAALKAGYSEKELGELRDARATMILNWASKYLDLMANKPKPVKRQGALRPGAISSRAAPNGLARAEKRLQRTGSVRDAAKAFEMDLDREKG